MSSLLEQAVIDAAALKEAAIKNAENAVLEKYAPEVKKVLDQLLEAEEDLGLGLEEEPGEEEMGMAPEDPAPASTVADDLPPAYGEGEKLCPCPEEEEEVVMDLDGLLADLEAEAEAGGLGASEAPMDREEDMLADEPAPMEESSQVNELIDILEKLTVDVKPVPHGHVGGGTEAEIEEAELQALAREQDTEVQEENEQLRKAVEDLEETVAKLQATKSEMAEENVKYKKAVDYLSEKIEEVNLSNAKLVYVNKVLNSASLNERQKTKIVDALSSSQTIEEAKVIFDTLQSAVGSAKAAPKSLSEAINRPSKVLPRRKRQADTLEEQNVRRMRRLAGLE
ncbi:MAG: hypothetical protein CMQ51_05580 [Gammaproteobacteria bacterium]|nr:hypothetical protein [Gammaproteobacteria bacterium]